MPDEWDLVEKSISIFPGNDIKIINVVHLHSDNTITTHTKILNKY